MLAAVHERYLDVLDLRLRALETLAAGQRANLALTSSNRALSRRFLKPLNGTWDDGDENLVRGFLDLWVRSGADPRQVAARSLLDAASALAKMQARPSTLWFFLWEMESMLPGLELR